MLRTLVKQMAEALMGAEVDALCGAPRGERHPERVNRRNGYRERAWDTRTGTIELAVPKLSVAGSYFPDWLLTPRKRSEQALVAAVADAYLAGVSTRRVDKLVRTLGIEGISRSSVSRLAASLDEIVEAFRSRPLGGRLPLPAARRPGRQGARGRQGLNVACVHAVGVNAEGVRESLGLDLVTSEDGAGWTAFLRGLVARGLSGVALVTSDAHPGLVDAIAATLPGASWQRCRTHFMRNLLCRVPKSAQPFVATLVRSIFAQPDAASVREQHTRVVAQLGERFPGAAELLEEAGPDILAFAAFPKELWRQVWSNNPLERLNREIRRRTDVVGIFPDRAAVRAPGRRRAGRAERRVGRRAAAT